MQKFKKIISIVILLVLIPILFMSMVILINSYTHPNKIPSFFGWKPFIVLSGSMETQISVGDVVIVKEVDTDISKFPDVPGAIIFPDLTAVNFANLLSFLNFLI